MLYRDIIKLETESNRFYDITASVAEIVQKCGIQEGLCNVFIPGTTAGIILNENDRLLIEDFRMLFEKTAPEEKLYSHPSNAFSHLRASLTDCEKTIPVSNGGLVLGTWQNIILWEFDVNPRNRDIVVTVSGEQVE